MAVIQFPDPSRASPEGIVAIGGDLEPETLLLAYRKGIFPWPVLDFPLVTWFCPRERAILEFSELHVPRSLERARKKQTFRFTFNQAFDQVIESCSKVERPGQPGTWITAEIIKAYRDFFRLGYAHSIEAWEDGKLVGGLYGVSIDGTFTGESMFHFKPNASKLALLHLVEHLQSKGLQWMDIQVMTPHMQNLGAKLISRDEFLHRLAETRALGLTLF